MNKLKKLCISIIFFIGIILISDKASATSITISPSEPKVGDEVKITVTVPNVHTSSVTADVTGVVSGKIKVVDGSLAGQVNTYSNSATFKCEKEGTINVQVTSDSSAVLNGQYVDVSAQKSVTVKAKDTTASDSNNSGNGTTGGNTTASKSTEARLSKFGIRPKEYDFNGFSKNPDKENWDAGEVPNSVTEIEVYATAKAGLKAKVAGTGKVSLKEGNNTIKVTVTAEAGNTKTYTLTIKRKTAEETQTEDTSGDASLKSLGIKPEKYDFSGFQKDKTNYSVQVPKDVKEIEIYAEATDTKAQIAGIGKKSLKEGKNNINIEVTAENGTKKTYTIEVTRGDGTTSVANDSDGEFGLSSLEISGVTLNPSFETGTYEYKVDLTEDLSTLDIRTIATDDDTTVEIYGNEELALGENTITILVRNEKEDKTATYQIIVNKSLAEEEKMSWLKPSTWGREEIIKVILIVVLIIFIIIAIILKIKIAKEKKNEENIDLPGGDELDKALAEHQELGEVTEIEEEKEDNKENEDEKNNKVKRKGKHF